MGGFQVARPTVNPIEQPDVLQNFTRLAQLRGLQQQQAQAAQEEPYRQQIMQEQAAQAPIQTQQMQQDQQDNQSFRDAMQDPSLRGKTIGQIADALAQKGKISQKAWVGAKDADLKTQQTLGTMADNNLKTLDSAYKTTQPIYDSVQKMDDQALAANWSTIAQQYDSIWQPVIAANPQLQGKMPMLNPNQPMTKAQLAQFGPMLTMGQAYADEENKRRAAAIDLKGKEATADFYAQNGGAPGVSEGMMQQADWLKKNPGKTASDFLLWKQKNSPAMLTMSNMFAGDQNQGGLDIAANNYRLSGQLPSMYKSPESIKAIINRAAELDQAAGGQGVAVNKTMLNADKTSLANMTKFSDSVQAFEQTAQKNIGLLTDAAKNIPDLGTKFANVPVRMITGNMIGTKNMAIFHTALNVAQTESAKVLNNPNSSAVLSDSARKDLQELVNGNMTYPAMMGALETLQKDMNNRTQSNKDQIKAIQDRLKSTSGPGQQSGGNQPSGNVVKYKIVNGQLVPE